jgi:nucleoside-diphosphate-sugar epimerase
VNFEKVLVTGAGGLMGDYVIKELRGHFQLSGLDILPDKNDLPHIQDSILNLDSVRAACEGMDAVVQIAAIPNIWSGSGSDIIHTNVTGTWNVLKAAQEAGVKRVILTSSDSVIGYTVLSGAMIPPSYLPIDHKHPRRPTDPYALSKKLCEEMAKSFVDDGAFEVVVMRPVFVLYPEFEEEIRARAADPQGYKGPVSSVAKPPGGGAMWHYVDPRDLATAYKQALILDKPGFGPYFICGPTILAPDETLKTLRHKTGVDIEVKDESIYENKPYAPLYDLTHAEYNLDFRAIHDLRKQYDLYGQL